MPTLFAHDTPHIWLGYQHSCNGAENLVFNKLLCEIPLVAALVVLFYILLVERISYHLGATLSRLERKMEIWSYALLRWHDFLLPSAVTASRFAACF